MNVLLLSSKAVGLWLFILAAAVANAALREKLLAPWLGRGPSLPLSGLILSGLILLISCVSMPFIGSSSEAVYHQVGLLWFVLTFSFELLTGRILMKKPWREILQVFDLEKGDLFSLVLVVLLSTPAFLIALLCAFMLLLAPLARGPSNPTVSYGLLAGALVTAALQAAAVVTVLLPGEGPRSPGAP